MCGHTWSAVWKRREFRINIRSCASFSWYLPLPTSFYQYQRLSATWTNPENGAVRNQLLCRQRQVCYSLGFKDLRVSHRRLKFAGTYFLKTLTKLHKAGAKARDWGPVNSQTCVKNVRKFGSVSNFRQKPRTTSAECCRWLLSILMFRAEKVFTGISAVIWLHASILATVGTANKALNLKLPFLNYHCIHFGILEPFM